MDASITVRALSDEDADAALWEAYVSSHADSTVYHCWPWKQVFERSFGYRAWYLVAEQHEPARVVGCLPLFLVSSPLSRRLVAVPFRDRGGILSDTPAAFDAILGTALRLKDEVGAKFLELKSLTRYDRGGLLERMHWVRSLLRFSSFGNDLDELFKRIGPKTRNMVRQAERAGLSCDVARDGEGVRAWYPIYLLAQQNLGLPPLPRLFFEELARGLEPSGAMRVFVVRKGDRAVAASIVLLHRRCGIYGYSASDPRERGLRPNDLMVHGIIRWLHENRFEEFDMGSDSPAQQSLLFFKKKWLAVQSTIPTYTHGEADHGASDSSDSRYALIRGGFRHLPTGLLHLVGRMTAKYFG